MKETFVDILGYEGLYKVSNFKTAWRYLNGEQ